MVLGVVLLKKGSWSCWMDSMTVLVVLFWLRLRAAGETAGTPLCERWWKCTVVGNYKP